MTLLCPRCDHPNGSDARFCLRCGVLLGRGGAGERDPLLGRELSGRYRLRRVIGEGGMGKVYLAEQKLGNATRNVAVKTLRAELSRDPQIVARFHRECETVVQLHHPNTVQFYDFGELDGGSVLFIVMEYIEGVDLAERLTAGPLAPPLVDKILIQICGSLHEAHQNGVVHRDLKPDNILLTQRGGQADFVKVLDFGIAKTNQPESESRTQLTMQGTILGTPPYMSPEQFGSEALDARSDVYSLGLIVYEMLTGRLPFEASTPWEWATRHLTEAPLDLSAHESGRALPPARRDAVMRALSKSREERQGSVMEFLREFTGINDTQTAWAVATSGPFEAVSLAGESPAAEPTAPPALDEEDPESPIVLPKRGLRGLTIAAALSAVAAASAAGYWVATHPGGGIHTPATAASVTAPRRERVAAPEPMPEAPAPEAASVPEPPPASDPAEGEARDSSPEPPPEPPPRRAARPRRAHPPQAPPAEPPRRAPAAPATEPAEAPAPAAPRTAAPPSTKPPEAPSAPAGPSPADIQRAASLIAEARAAMASQNVSAAAAKIASARPLAPEGDAAVGQATRDLATLGGRSIGNLLMRGRCDEAQAQYRALRSAKAHGPAGSHFADDWCPKP